MPLSELDEIMIWEYRREEGGNSSGGSRAFAPPVVAPAMQTATEAAAGRAGASGLRGVLTLLGEAAGSALALLLVPMASGPDGTGDAIPPPPAPPPSPPPATALSPEPLNAPDPFADPFTEPEALPELEEVVVTPPRIPPPSTGTRVGEDPIMPPNWNDIANPGGKSFEFPDRFGRPDRPFPLVPIPGDQPGLPPAPELPVGEPELDPGFDPVPLPLLRPSPAPPSGLPTPDLSPAPLELPTPGPSLDPFGEPLPFPSTQPTPGPNARPTAAPEPVTAPALPTMWPYVTPLPGIPDLFAEPLTPPATYRPPAPGPSFDLLDPMAETHNPTLLEYEPREYITDDQCQCDKKKPKKKKSSERSICYKGTYQQLKKGISYHRKEQVPCESSAPKEKKAKKPRKRTMTQRDYRRGLPGLPGYKGFALNF